MYSKNFLSFCRQLRRLGGHIISKQLKRPHSGSKWLSSFTALSFTFFSAFPALPNQAPLLVSEKPVAVEESSAVASESDSICDFRRDLRDIQAASKKTLQEQERLCGKKTEEILSTDTESASELEMRGNIEKISSGYPLEDMAPSIARFDKSIAGLLVGIAKKESSWGEHAPSKGGEDCYNYWGYKGAGGRGESMGYACFESREEAVETVGNRLERLVEKRASAEPSRLVTAWKCGDSCASHSKESVAKWISDVDQYYRQIALR